MIDDLTIKKHGSPRLRSFSVVFLGIMAVVGYGCGESRAPIDRPKADLSQFDHVGSFADGLAPVRKGVMWAYADESGKTITKFVFEEAEAFSEGLAAVKTNGKSTNQAL